MWTCPKCNEQHEDNFDSCRKCSENHEEITTKSSTTASEASFKPIRTYFIMIAVAMLFSCPSPKGILFVFFFPYGLGMYLGIANEKIAALIAYVIYAGMFGVFVSAKSLKSYRIAIAVLTVLLIMNIGGCNKILDGFSSVT